MLSPDGVNLTFQYQSSNGTLTPVLGNAAGAFAEPQTNFTLALVGSWPSTLSTLTSASTTWTLTDSDDTVWTLQTLLDPWTGQYDIARPVKKVQRAGLTWTFAYGAQGQLSSITDSFGNTITFNWLIDNFSANGGSILPRAISAAHLPGGYTINYGYATIGGFPSAYAQPDILTHVQYLNASGLLQDQVSYEYGNTSFPHAITAIDDSAGVQRWLVTYNSVGQATSSSGPGGVDQYTVAYGTIGSTFTRTVTNPLGKQAIYSYSNGSALQLTGVSGVASTHCPASASAVTYGSDGFIATMTDENGDVTAFPAHDPRGMPSKLIEASGTASARTTTYTWSPTLHVPTQVAQPGLTTSYAYNTAGQLTAQTQTDTTSFTTPYATNGRSRTWHYNWSAAGQLLSVIGPLGSGDTTTYGYNANGYLQTVKNPLGQTTSVTAWDWRGAPLTVVDPNGVSTTITYDIHGRPQVLTLNPGSSQSQYQLAYNAVGDVTQITLPTGAWLQYGYDKARRVTLISNNRGETRAFTYDLADDPLTEVTKNSSSTITQQISAAYDELTRTIQSVGAAGPGTQSMALAYDKDSNLTRVVDPLNNVRSTSFDQLNRVITTTDPERHTTQLAYDGKDNLTSFKDGRALQTTRIVDGFGQVIQETSPDRGARTYWYDAEGDLTKRIDGDGVETDYSYDNAQRLLSKTFPSDSAEAIAVSYDNTSAGNRGVGRFTGVTDQSGSTSVAYDAQGRLTGFAKVISGRSYPLAYAYDANGQVVQITYPSGRIVSIARASDGKAMSVTTRASSGSAAVNVATNVTYAPFGPLTSLTYGNGLNLTRSYDQNYWLTRIQVAGGGLTPLDLSFTRNNDSRLGAVVDNAATGRGATFGYTGAANSNASRPPSPR